ncbi:hypothetical protein EON65_10125 [archaeon]|nr:MAG: hypothetical protein EON65_10125 [archaeon]
MGLPVFRKRDLLVLGILLVTFYHFSQHLPSSTFRLQPSWFVELSEVSTRTHASNVQVVDIDGDGDKDLLLIDKDESVKLFKLRSIADFESTDIYHPEEIATIDSLQGSVVCAPEPHELFLYCVTKDGKLKAVNTHNNNNDFSLVWAVELTRNSNNNSHNPYNSLNVSTHNNNGGVAGCNSPSNSSSGNIGSNVHGAGAPGPAVPSLHPRGRSASIIDRLPMDLTTGIQSMIV